MFGNKRIQRMKKNRKEQEEKSILVILPGYIYSFIYYILIMKNSYSIYI